MIIKLHEVYPIDTYIDIMKVPGGLIYIFKDKDFNIVSTQFISYKKDIIKL